MALARDESWTGDWLIENSQKGCQQTGYAGPGNKDYKAFDFTTRAAQALLHIPALLQIRQNPYTTVILHISSIMATPRFFSSVPLEPNQTIELPQELAHHALRVLRLKPDTDIVLFDGRGGQYCARLTAEGKKGYAQTGEHQTTEAELPGEIILAQGLPSGDKMDWVIEKAVELGATRIVPIAAQRSVLQLSGERLAKRMRHWERIAQSASEQCGRNRIMHIDEPRPLSAYLAGTELAAQLTLLCHPGAGQSLEAALAQHTASRIALLVGPEGGWSEEEQAAAIRPPIQAVRFGSRVLRTETAGLALMAAIAALKGWL